MAYGQWPHEHHDNGGYIANGHQLAEHAVVQVLMNRDQVTAMSQMVSTLIALRIRLMRIPRMNME